MLGEQLVSLQKSKDDLKLDPREEKILKIAKKFLEQILDIKRTTVTRLFPFVPAHVLKLSLPMKLHITIEINTYKIG